MNAERSLAHIETIAEVQPIPEKDRIVLAKVLGWNVVIGKDEFAVGDKVVFVEVDSRLNTAFGPFSALAKDADKHGFVHIKTRKFGGSYSQGICFRVPERYGRLKEGSDLTEKFNKGKEGKNLAIVHNEEYKSLKEEWNSPPKKSFAVRMWKRILHRLFPGKKRGGERNCVPDPYSAGVRKTDEERIQNLVELFERLRAEGTVLTATEKLDGQSFTAHMDQNGKIYVASRNVPLYFAHSDKEKRYGTYEGSNWQKVYEKYDLGKVLDLIRKELFVSAVTIQGEIIGTGIQGNPYGFTGEEKRLMVFNVIADGKRLPYTEMKAVCAGCGLETVPLIGSVALDSATTIEKFIEMSDGVSAVNAAAMREGIVYRTEDYRLSFKAVSNRYLMKRGE